MVHKQKRSTEYFSEAEYGVKASPRVSLLKSGLPRGGGRDQLGRPYKVRGKWYHPKEDRDYRKAGLASWYGDAFHGRLTANGEIYDMTHLTAAHPTMPLPSYARVTNTENGSSVIVRVNDRGPYSDGRIIDLSKRAAEMLGYTRSGTAKVQVEYVGRAPLHGQDDQFLMASYQPGNRAPDPSDGLPDGVMIAMNGATPGQAIDGPPPGAPFPGELTDVALGDDWTTGRGEGSAGMPLPALGPAVPERPGIDIVPGEMMVASATMSYSAEPSASRGAFAALDLQGTAVETAGGWKSSATAAVAGGVTGPYVVVGSYSDAAEAAAVAARLSEFGRVEIDASADGGAALHMVSLYPGPAASVDDLLRRAWASGAVDAFAVRQ